MKIGQERKEKETHSNIDSLITFLEKPEGQITNSQVNYLFLIESGFFSKWIKTETKAKLGSRNALKTQY